MKDLLPTPPIGLQPQDGPIQQETEEVLMLACLEGVCDFCQGIRQYQFFPLKAGERVDGAPDDCHSMGAIKPCPPSCINNLS
jgi:hypothetical protein